MAEGVGSPGHPACVLICVRWLSVDPSCLLACRLKVQTARTKRQGILVVERSIGFSRSRIIKSSAMAAASCFQTPMGGRSTTPSMRMIGDEKDAVMGRSAPPGAGGGGAMLRNVTPRRRLHSPGAMGRSPKAKRCPYRA